ncbi:hypothetical protein BJN34_12995 [Cupriavidus necator]|uniref:Uncharacterized protein n=1 Tax=Cupriavidus necator TaxID=106590 RepID=A0A1U9UQ77_CUPNE|nr:hypothetical protein [Cupriavidus necator]AQV94798.1 hypothetical protein BJN34_12995 [Cupriavidus necator]
MTESIIKPKRPTGSGWIRETGPAIEAIMRAAAMGFVCEAWVHPETGIATFSAVEVAHDPSQADLGPEYHLSISKNNRRGGTARTTSAEALWCLAQFDLIDAKEDNHVPHGLVRNFWRPVADQLSGYECPCTGDEPAMREDKGDYVWRGVTK